MSRDGTVARCLLDANENHSIFAGCCVVSKGERAVRNIFLHAAFVFVPTSTLLAAGSASHVTTWEGTLSSSQMVLFAFSFSTYVPQVGFLFSL